MSRPNPAKFERCVKAVAKRGGANPYAVCTAAGTRKNPSEDEEFVAAAQASEEFHGTPAHETLAINSTIREHENLSVCGELIRLDIISVNGGIVKLKNFDGAILSQSPKGFKPQLYIEGGDQTVPLDVFDIDDPHEIEVLGRLTRVIYYTVKYHLGRDGGEANYKHKFGDRGPIFKGKLKGVLPTVTYDCLSELLTIAGGKYEILPEGIDN